MPEQEEDKKIVRAIVDKIIFHNKINGYNILSADITGDGKEFVTITINHPNIVEGVTYNFSGEWNIHPKFGRQLKATHAAEQTPSTLQGLKSYLQSSHFNGVGPVIAERIIKHFGENVLDIFENDINKILIVPGISKIKLESIKESWKKNKEINSIMVFLQSYGISTLFASKILETYKQDCIKKIQENPYELARSISGIGFKAADTIALNMGWIENSPKRINACIHYILENEGNNEGHCYLTELQVLEGTSKYLNLNNISDLIKTCLFDLINKQEIILVEFNDKIKRYYSKKVYKAENYVANRISSMLQDNNSGIEIHEEIFDKVFKKMDFEMSEEQKSAVRGILKSNISIITGGPGVGKSFITKAILEILHEVGASFIAGAPTGRASKRIMQATGFDASTLHKILSWNHQEKTFLHNQDNKLEVDYIFIDETSMVSINLAAAVFRALKEKTKIILIGDKDQLPSIEVGNFFKDLIEINKIPVFSLTKIYRQAENSFISEYARDINNGIVPIIESPLLKPELWKNGTDCLFLDSGFRDPNKEKLEYPAWHTLRYDLDLFEMIVKLYKETITKYHIGIKEIQVLCPQNVGPCGNVKLNELLQKEINPPAEGKKELIIKHHHYRQFDKVICLRNNYDLDVFNGDMGIIIDIDNEKMSLTIELQEGNIVVFEKADIFDLALSYSVSIHKSQGSEFEAVIFPLTKNHYRMLQKNLIYTGITRSKKFLAIIGQREALEIAVKNDAQAKRQTSLKEMIEMNMEIINL